MVEARIADLCGIAPRGPDAAPDVRADCARISDFDGVGHWQEPELEAHFTRQEEGYCNARCGTTPSRLGFGLLALGVPVRL